MFEKVTRKYVFIGKPNFVIGFLMFAYAMSKKLTRKIGFLIEKPIFVMGFLMFACAMFKKLTGKIGFLF